MKINCIVIEDEPLALKKVKNFISQVEYLNLLEEFDNALEAIGFLKENTVDLIFLDIRMRKLSGIQFLESLNIKSKVIITSAYEEYALKGYELNVSDYLLKPLTFNRFLKSVDKVYDELIATNGDEKSGYVFVKTENRIERINLNDILYIQGMKDYLQISTTKKKVMTLQTFKNIIDILPESEFQRVHNSYIVAVSKIDRIERNKIIIDNELIPISGGYKDKFYHLLKEKKIFI